MMRWTTNLLFRVKALFSWRRMRDELDEEMAFHIERETEKHIARGMSPEDARRQALLAFGGVQYQKARVQDAWGVGVIQDLRSDVRHTLRGFRRNPVFTLVAVLTLALGIGGTTAIFSVVNGVLLKPLPYPEAERIAYLGESNLAQGWPTFSVSPLNFRDWQSRNGSVELMGAYRRITLTYTGGDRPGRLRAYQVTEDYLEILGGEPVLGRGFVHEDLTPDQEGVVLLSHGFWEESFGGDPEVLGRSLDLDGEPYTIVGVLPEGWRHPFDRAGVEILVPLRFRPSWRRFNHFLRVLARVRPGITLEQAQADLSSVAAALETEYPDTNTGWGVSVRPLEEVLVGQTRPQLLILLASVGLVLLIACVNVAQMTLARGSGRVHEMAIRTALGAGRTRIVRQLLSESLVLSLFGGSLGILLSVGCLRTLFLLWPQVLPRMEEIEINGAILCFAVAVSFASGLLSGLFPALRVAGSKFGEAFLKSRSGLTVSTSLRRLRGVLVVVEVSLATALLVGSGLLIRSFVALQSENPGFQAEGRLAIPTPLSVARYPTREGRQAYGEAVLGRLSTVPGVESVAVTNLVPVTGADQIGSLEIEGRPPSGPNDDISVVAYSVSPGYLATMGIPLLAGREFTSGDRGDTPLVLMISESFARAHFPGEDAVGKRVRFGGEGNPFWEIVGVAGEVQHYEVGSTSLAQVYLPFTQWLSSGGFNFVIRASVPPLSLVGAIRTEIQAVDGDMPVEGVQTLEQIIAGNVSTPRFRTMLLTSFGLTALILAVVGLYGVISYTVGQRLPEFGMRMALGAQQSGILRLVLRDGIPPLAIGLILGVAGSLGFNRVLESMLFGVGAHDPGVLVSVPLLLLAVALLAMLVPAFRATRVDPTDALRWE